MDFPGKIIGSLLLSGVVTAGLAFFIGICGSDKASKTLFLLAMIMTLASAVVLLVDAWL